MERQVDALFGEAVMQEAVERFGLKAGQEYVKKLGDFENYVYEMQTLQGESVIVRFTHSSHRSEDMIDAELAWIDFLLEEGVNIPRCYKSQQGKRTERIEAGESYFTAAMFQKAGGKKADFHNPAVWNSELFREWGRLTGQMHRATSRYQVPDGKVKRPQWDEDDLLLGAQRYMSEGDEFVLEGLEEVLGHLRRLPQDNQSYGLIHADIHPGNFFVENGQISVFDFDDSAYNWFVHDLAMPLYYSLSWAVSEEHRESFAAEFMKAFWEGYRQEHALDPKWLLELPYLLRLRDYTLYFVFHKKMDLESMDDRIKRWLEAIRSRLKRKVPIAELDYRKLLEE